MTLNGKTPLRQSKSNNENELIYKKKYVNMPLASSTIIFFIKQNYK